MYNLQHNILLKLGRNVLYIFMPSRKDMCHCGQLKDSRAKKCRSCKDAEPIEKKCSSCNLIYPINQYNYRVNGRGGYKRRSRCKQCEIKEAKEYRKKNPDKVKKSKKIWEQKNPEKHERGILRRSIKKLKLSVPEVLEYIDKHNGTCEICGRSGITLAIDHCHKNGNFRGLLCSKCNCGLGLFCDNKEILEKAILYLSNKTLL